MTVGTADTMYVCHSNGDTFSVRSIRIRQTQHKANTNNHCPARQSRTQHKEPNNASVLHSPAYLS